MDTGDHSQPREADLSTRERPGVSRPGLRKLFETKPFTQSGGNL